LIGIAIGTLVLPVAVVWACRAGSRQTPPVPAPPAFPEVLATVDQMAAGFRLARAPAAG
jgi:hypothetical protein